MKKKAWLYADPHFGHRRICEFLRDDGTKLRPWDDVLEMDEEMVQRYNDTVGANDVVYFLGDVVINRKALPTLGRLHGDKVLIRGNHDIFKLNEYIQYFRDIRACDVKANFVLSHIPIHPESKGRFFGNIHGHLLQRRVMLDGNIDPWYYCVSVEHTDYKPIMLDEVVEIIKNSLK